MLQLYVYGPKEQGFLDIAEKTVLQFENQSDAFDENLSVGTFTLPLELVWTSNNRRLLGFAEQLENQANFANYYKIDVLDDGWPEIVAGKMVILEKIGNYAYTNGTFNISISGSKGLFGSLIYKKKMNSLQLGGTIQWAELDSRAFATAVMKGEYPQYSYIRFCPVAIENFFDKNRPDFTTEFLAKDTVNTVVITGTGANDWQFGRPVNSNPNDLNSSLIPATEGQVTYTNYRTVPFFQFKYVLKQIFTEYGFTLMGDVVDSTDWDDLFLFNNYSIEYFVSNIDYNKQIVPSNHMPNTANSTYMLISDFLKNALSFFKAYITFNSGSNTATIRYQKRNVIEKNVFSLTPYMIDFFDSTIDIDNQNKGYKISYSWDTYDQYHSDRIKELTKNNSGEPLIGEKNLIGTVPTRSSLDSFTYSRTITINDCVFVEADNMYYSLANGSVTPKLWDVYSEGLQDYEQRNNKLEEPARTVNIGMSPLCTYVELNSVTGLYEKRHYVGTRGAGSYQNNKNVRVLNTFGLSIFYCSKQTINGNNIPTSYNHNRNTNNEKIQPYSLALKPKEGIATNFHTDIENILEKAEVVKTSIQVDKKLWYEISQYNQVEVNGVLFLIQKSESTLPILEPITIYLIPL